MKENKNLCESFT